MLADGPTIDAVVPDLDPDVLWIQSSTVGVADTERYAARHPRFLDAPMPVASFTGASSTSIANGRRLFSSIGCAFCHNPRFRTTNTAIAALRNKDVNLYSDLLVHNMGVGLADGVSQGSANGREFRTGVLQV